MTRKDAEKLWPIIKAFGEGEAIEWSSNGVSWGAATSPTWEPLIMYRIKPQPKLVPFTFEDNLLFRDKYVRIKGCIALSKITNFGKDGIYFKGNDDQVSSYQYLLNNCEFEDSSPCGKYIEE